MFFSIQLSFTPFTLFEASSVEEIIVEKNKNYKRHKTAGPQGSNQAFTMT